MLYASEQTKARASGVKENRNRMSEGLTTLDEKHLKDNFACDPKMHTAYRSVLGQL